MPKVSQENVVGIINTGGGKMLVSRDKLDSYLAAGCTLAPEATNDSTEGGNASGGNSGGPEESVDDGLEKMKVSDLHILADDEDMDLPEGKKADLIAFIRAERLKRSD